MLKKNVISIIPARGGSKGIPEKNIIEIAGKPLIAWTIEQSIKTRSIYKTYVSTNDNQIADISKQYGAEIIWRPEEICGDTATSESAILHALDYLKEEQKLEPDYVVFLQATSPLRKKDDIKKAIKKIINDETDSLFSGSKFEDFLFWEKRNGNWESVNYDYKNRGIRQDRNPQFVENGSIYIFKPEIIRKYNNRIGGKLTLYEMEFWQTWQIDAKEDIELIEYYFDSKIKQNEYKVLREVKIELIAFDFDGVFTDNKVITLQDGTEGILANRSDGLAINELKEMKIPMVIISTEKNYVVQARGYKLGVEVIQDVANKKEVLVNYCKRNKICLENVVFIGNDINDKMVMEKIGWPICPQDANDGIKKISKIILSKKGGEGVIRELYEILKN